MGDDGNCQFRALSYALYGTQEEHELVRAQVINRIRMNRALFEPYFPSQAGPESFDGKLNELSKLGKWGDNVTLTAAAGVFGIKVEVWHDTPNRGRFERTSNLGSASTIISQQQPSSYQVRDQNPTVILPDDFCDLGDRT